MYVICEWCSFEALHSLPPSTHSLIRSSTFTKFFLAGSSSISFIISSHIFSSFFNFFYCSLNEATKMQLKRVKGTRLCLSVTAFHFLSSFFFPLSRLCSNIRPQLLDASPWHVTFRRFRFPHSQTRPLFCLLISFTDSLTLPPPPSVPFFLLYLIPHGK